MLSHGNLVRQPLPVLLALVAASCLKPAGIRYPGLPTTADSALHIVVFDVGQGDAMLVMYKGKSLMVDVGGPLREPLKASRVIPRRLDALLGTRHLDYFMASHYHADHIGTPGSLADRRRAAGLFSLIERDGVTFDTILDRGTWVVGGKKGEPQRQYEKSVTQWLAAGTAKKRRVINVGDRIDMGEGIEVEVRAASGNGLLDRLERLYPRFIRRALPNENDYSIGFTLSLGDFEMFSGGDLSGRSVVRQKGPKRMSYTDIESRIRRDVGPLEVYRVNHHGSRYSTNPCFAATLRPMVSIFSTGDNRYGHPDPEVYERLKGYGDVYITGGADPRHRASVASDIVRDDVEILVAPDGSRFWVNGKAYHSLSDAEELARPAGEITCPESGAEITPADYETRSGSVKRGRDH